MAKSSFDEKFAALREKYVSRLPESLEVMEKFVKSGKINNKLLEELRFEAHKLSGTGSTYGFSAISASGRALEEEIDENNGKNLQKLTDLTETLIKDCKDPKQDKPKEIKQVKNVKKSPINRTRADKKPLLLAVDDDENVLNLIKKLFKDDATIITANDGKTALELLKTKKPDLAILDDVMPKLNGIKLLSKLKKTDILDRTQIIMLTGKVGSRDIMQAVTSGATDYITKPFDAEDLAEKVRALLKQQSKKILIIDDNEDTRDLLEHKFRSKGFKVFLAEDGIEGLEKAEKELPNLIVLDRMMSGLNGAAVLQKLKGNKTTDKIPVMFLTAKRAEDDIVEGFQLGAADYIIKPFITEEVVARSIRLIDNNMGNA